MFALMWPFGLSIHVVWSSCEAHIRYCHHKLPLEDLAFSSVTPELDLIPFSTSPPIILSIASKHH